jgi:hypothetical protein
MARATAATGAGAGAGKDDHGPSRLTIWPRAGLDCGATLLPRQGREVRLMEMRAGHGAART